MTLGDLLQQLVNMLTEFWPIHRVNEWQQGVVTRAGKIVKTATVENGVFGSGFHLILPFVYEFYTENTVRDVQITPRLDFMSADGVAVSVRLAAHYEVSDLSKMYRSIQDYDDSVMTTLCSEVVEVGLKLSFDELGDFLCNSALDKIRRILGPWGIRVKQLKVASLVRVKPFRLLGDASSAVTISSE